MLTLVALAHRARPNEVLNRHPIIGQMKISPQLV